MPLRAFPRGVLIVPLPRLLKQPGRVVSGMEHAGEYFVAVHRRVGWIDLHGLVEAVDGRTSSPRSISTFASMLWALAEAGWFWTVSRATARASSMNPISQRMLAR